MDTLAFSQQLPVGALLVRRTHDGFEVLIAQRAADRALFPGKWECGGGMVRRGESFEGALRRQVFEEFGLHVQSAHVLELYEIHTTDRLQPVIPGVRLLSWVTDERVRLCRREFVRCEWVPVTAIPTRDFIGTIGLTLRTLHGRLPCPVPSAPRRREIGFGPR